MGDFGALAAVVDEEFSQPETVSLGPIVSETTTDQDERPRSEGWRVPRQESPEPPSYAAMAGDRST
ncbi:hypothetical protein GCM10027176_05240 [Actinoallomurus bryophytorum]